VDLVARLTDAVVDLARTHDRVLVAIDGPDAAGKTTLADRLAAVLPAPVTRLSVDDFLQPPAVRYRRGKESPEGFYRDSFDGEAFAAACAAGGAIVVADGIFLLRLELRGLWTLSVHLRVSEGEAVRRAKARDLDLFGTAEDVERWYRLKYLPGQALYRLEADPEAHADVLVDNEDPATPAVLRWGR
jgi:uridine kinase